MKLIKASASWCQPCKSLSTVISNMSHPLLENIINIDIDEQMDESMRYRVRSVPTMILADDSGKEIRRVSGALNQSQLLKFLNGE